MRFVSLTQLRKKSFNHYKHCIYETKFLPSTGLEAVWKYSNWFAHNLLNRSDNNATIERVIIINISIQHTSYRMCNIFQHDESNIFFIVILTMDVTFRASWFVDIYIYIYIYILRSKESHIHCRNYYKKYVAYILLKDIYL